MGDEGGEGAASSASAPGGPVPALLRASDWRRMGGWAAIVLGIGAALWILRPVLTTIALAFAVAYLFSPLVDRLERRRVPRSVSILLLLLTGFALVVAAVALLVPLVEREIADVVANVPAYREHAGRFIDEDLRPWVKLHTGYELPSTIQAFWRQNAEKISSLVPDLAAKAWELVRKTLSNVVALLSFVVNVILFPVFLFYLLKDMPRIRASVLEAIPARQRARMQTQLLEVDRVLSSFVRGQITVALFLAVVYSVGLSLIGIDLAIVIGCAAGAAFFIPYAGYAVGLSAASAMSLARFGIDSHLLWIVGLFVGAGMLEAYVITPKLVGERVGLHPVVMITAVIVGGSLFGFLGVLLAIPVTAAGGVFWRAGLARYKQSEFYLAGKQGES